MKAVVGVAAVLVLIGGGLGYKMYSQHQEELAKVQAEKERIAKKLPSRRRSWSPGLRASRRT